METNTLIFLCLLVGTVNLIALILILSGRLQPRLIRHVFTHHFEGLQNREEATPEPERVPPEADKTDPPVIAKLRELGFTVHEEFFEPKPHQVGDLLVFQYPNGEPCHDCGAEMRIFMEVIDHDVPGRGTIAADLNEIGEVCENCGHFHRHDEEDLEPKGVFRLGPPHSSDLLEFLDDLSDAANERVRVAYLKELAESERTLQKRLFRLRQRIMNARIASHEAKGEKK